MIELLPQHVDEIGLHEDDGRELVAGAELQLRLVAASETVFARVRASAIRVEGPSKRHALDAIERRAAPNLLISSLIGTPLRLGQRADAALFNHPGDVASRQLRRAKVEEERRHKAIIQRK